MKTIWQRYSEGEKLQPTFGKVKPVIPISMVQIPKPQKARGIKQSGSFIETALIIIFAIFGWILIATQIN